MSDESSKTPFGLMNRRKMLGTTTALVGGAVAGVAGSAFAQDKPKAPASSTPAAAPATGPNLNPPVLQLECGKIRGLREGKTFSFLGIRYAEAERFGLPKAVGPFGPGGRMTRRRRREERAGMGSRLPEPGADHRQL